MPFCVHCVFFFKQKTAYEMRISDWSSDVCSSDLSISTGRIKLDDTPVEHGRKAQPCEIGHHRPCRQLADSAEGERREQREHENRDDQPERRLDPVRGKEQRRPDQIERELNTEQGERSRATVRAARSEEHTSELQSLMRNSYAVFC